MMKTFPVYIRSLLVAIRSWDFGAGFRSPQSLVELADDAPLVARVLERRPSAEIGLILRAMGEAEVSLLYRRSDAYALGLRLSSDVSRSAYLHSLEQRLSKAYDRVCEYHG